MGTRYRILSYPFKLFHRQDTNQNGVRLRQLIEQVLFVSPGERVNRPDFGTGLQNLLFAPNHSELNPTYRLMIQASLQRWLNEDIDLTSVDIEQREEQLAITISYKPKLSDEESQETFRFNAGQLFA